eukprot:TRINITY_DN64042_c0_g1_i1.p1 TRINITY_DN64042_c0_g1~~TRINITY_DN64042_c0_g1_i1.p1  ORF type:complete len:539 (+),score=90.96 TRINITY_DN64042_c0_g1_i1:224-1618(+)
MNRLGSAMNSGLEHKMLNALRYARHHKQIDLPIFATVEKAHQEAFKRELQSSLQMAVKCVHVDQPLEQLDILAAVFALKLKMGQDPEYLKEVLASAAEPLVHLYCEWLNRHPIMLDKMLQQISKKRCWPSNFIRIQLEHVRLIGEFLDAVDNKDSDVLRRVRQEAGQHQLEALAREASFEAICADSLVSLASATQNMGTSRQASSEDGLIMIASTAQCSQIQPDSDNEVDEFGSLAENGKLMKSMQALMEASCAPRQCPESIKRVKTLQLNCEDLQWSQDYVCYQVQRHRIAQRFKSLENIEVLSPIKTSRVHIEDEDACLHCRLDPSVNEHYLWGCEDTQIFEHALSFTDDATFAGHTCELTLYRVVLGNVKHCEELENFKLENRGAAELDKLKEELMRKQMLENLVESGVKYQSLCWRREGKFNKFVIFNRHQCLAVYKVQVKCLPGRQSSVIKKIDSVELE